MTIRFTGARARALVAGTSLLALSTACARKDAATDSATASSGSSSAAPAASASASANAMTQAQKEDVHDAIRGYQLTEDNVDKVIAATQKMHALEKSNPQLAAAMQRDHGGGDAKSVDEVASRMEAMPPVKAILSSVGISARDYVLTTFTLMEAGAAYQIQKAGKLPPNSELAKDVSPANLAYIGSHQAQLRALEKADGSRDQED